MESKSFVVRTGIFGLALLAALAAGELAVQKSHVGLTASAHPAPVHPGVDGIAARLHNGWVIYPIGEQTPTGDMPTELTLSRDGKYTAVATTGWQKPTISVYEVGAGPAASRDADTSYPRQARFTMSLPDVWHGMSFGRDANADVLFISGGKRGVIYRLKFTADQTDASKLEPIVLSKQEGAYAGALDVLPDGSLVATDEAPGHPTLNLIDPDTGIVVKQFRTFVDGGAIVAAKDGQSVYLANHGQGKVVRISLVDGHTVSTIEVGHQPVALLSDGDHRIYCANSGSDSVSVIDTATDTMTGTWKTSPGSTSALGSVPTAVALSPDHARLYVTNGGNNDVAVLSTSDGKLMGLIPTGRYPVSVATSPKGDWLFVGVGKGLRTLPNDKATGFGTASRVGQPSGQMYGPHSDQALSHDYILSTVTGSLTRLPTPDDAALAKYTELALKGIPFRESLLQKAEGKPSRSVMADLTAAPTPIKHVVYIIKENRTYDQVFGDMPKGDGDPNLVLYGRKVSPNHHKIADQFVLLDNVYCDGEVSQDGWEWCCAANDSDWNTKATLRSYGRGVMQPGSRETIRPSNGYIWENADEHGLTYYSYGAKTFQSLFSPTWKGHISPGFDEDRADGMRDDQKVDVFISDLKKAEQLGKWPNLMVMSLPDDHTTGTRPGARTPYASVGSNDLAVGKLVDAVSHSKFWKETAVFVIEDDAQNGPDHVDAHRTVALVASAYTRRGSVDHNMYTSSSFVRSIELLLGLPPKSQYDAAAPPMFTCFDGPLNLTPYTVEKPQVDITAINKRTAVMARESSKLDFSDVDRADENTLNHVLWADARPGQAYPGVVHRYFPAPPTQREPAKRQPGRD